MSNESELRSMMDEMLSEDNPDSEDVAFTLMGSIALYLAKIVDLLESKSGDFYDDSTAPQ